MYLDKFKIKDQLCEFDIERDICLPLVPPGNALDDMILVNDSKNIKGDAPS